MLFPDSPAPTICDVDVSTLTVQSTNDNDEAVGCAAPKNNRKWSEKSIGFLRKHGEVLIGAWRLKHRCVLGLVLSAKHRKVGCCRFGNWQKMAAGVENQMAGFRKHVSDVKTLRPYVRKIYRNQCERLFAGIECVTFRLRCSLSQQPPGQLVSDSHFSKERLKKVRAERPGQNDCHRFAGRKSFTSL